MEKIINIEYLKYNEELYTRVEYSSSIEWYQGGYIPMSQIPNYSESKIENIEAEKLEILYKQI